MPPPETTTCGGSEPGNYTPATTGLAGGITFALHKDFCTKLLPLFPEENPSGAAQETTFLTCENLRDVVKRSLDTWAINHRSIYFTDVTELCKEETSFSSCPHAEIFIVSNDLPPSSGGDRAAVAQPTFTSGRVYTTAGQRIDNGYEINSAVITVRTPADKDELCWYLDSTFCFQFHRWQDAEVDVVSIARLVCSVMFIIAFFICVWILGSTCSAFCGNPDAGEYDDEYEEEGEPGQSPPPSPPEVDKPELDKSRFTSMHHMHGGAGSFHDILRKAGAAGIGEHGDEEHLTCGSQRCTNMMEYISVMPTIPLLASIFWMCFAPVFYYRVFQPCWECHGFEASLTHEIGHVLGFHHPDVEMPLNLKADTEMNASTCYSSLDYVHLAMNDPTTAVPTDSLMFSQTLHRYRTCLSNDDLEGLNYLYPTCEGAFEPQGEYLEPLCIKASRFAGWLRLGLVTSVPFFLSATFIVLVQMWVRHQARKRHVSMEATTMRLRAQRAALVNSLKKKARRKGSVHSGRTTTRRSRDSGDSGGFSSTRSRGRSESGESVGFSSQRPANARLSMSMRQQAQDVQYAAQRAEADARAKALRAQQQVEAAERARAKAAALAQATAEIQEFAPAARKPAPLINPNSLSGRLRMMQQNQADSEEQFAARQKAAAEKAARQQAKKEARESRGVSKVGFSSDSSAGAPQRKSKPKPLLNSLSQRLKLMQQNQQESEDAWNARVKSKNDAGLNA